MKKYLVLTVCAAMVLTGCGTYTGAGAYTGANIGSVLGSAIGGISGGHRGYHLGTIVGMAGGAIVGGAIGSATDKKHSDDVHRHYEQVQQRKAQQGNSDYSNSGYDNRRYETNSNGYSFDSTDSGYDETNSGDDRLYDFDSSDYTGDYSASEARTTTPAASSANKMYSDFGYSPQIQIRNARFVDDNHDNTLVSNEVSKVIFEVVNTSNEPLYDIVPTVVESTGNKRIYISPSMHVERLAPGAAIRYTAMVKAGKLKDGTATFCVSVLQGNKAMSQVQEFTVRTRR